MHIKLDLRDSLTKHGADPMTQPEFARFVVSEPESAAIIITLGKQPNYFRIADNSGVEFFRLTAGSSAKQMCQPDMRRASFNSSNQ